MDEDGIAILRNHPQMLRPEALLQPRGQGPPGTAASAHFGAGVQPGAARSPNPRVSTPASTSGQRKLRIKWHPGIGTNGGGGRARMLAAGWRNRRQERALKKTTQHGTAGKMESLSLGGQNQGRATINGPYLLYGTG